MSSVVASHRQYPCELCDGQSFEILSRRDRRNQPLTTVVCRQCGLVSHEEIPSDQELAAYYRSEYRQDYNGEFSPSPYRVVREWQRGKELLETLRGHLQQEDKILEVGSGIGCTVKNFELAGYDCHGIEPGQGFCEYSRDRLGAQVRNCELAQLPRELHYDAVLLVHVLEHFNHPRVALAQIRSTLRCGGLLYVEVPNFGLPHARPTKLFHYAHIYNFTLSTLSMLGRASGFEVHQVLSQENERNLRILFQVAERVEWALDEGSCERSKQAVRRYNWLTYHARWSYLSQRVGSLIGKLRERRTADRQLQQIIALCRSRAESSKARAA